MHVALIEKFIINPNPVASKNFSSLQITVYSYWPSWTKGKNLISNDKNCM